MLGPTSADQPSDKRKILILEDDFSLLQLLEDFFRSYRFEVETYADPEDAEKSFTNPDARFDLVLMDLKLGNVDGRKVYKKFKEHNANSKIFILTGLDVDVPSFKEVCPSFEEGLLFKKPVKIGSMKETIESIL